MTDLTEQWKKGELNRNKIYYYETPFNTTDTASGFWLCNHLDTEKDKVKILGEVPSYEEWKDLKSKLQLKETAYDFDTARLEDENAQLKERVSKLEKMQYSYTPEEWNTMLRTVNRTKELLKECKGIFDECFSPSAKHGELYKKIDEVLR